MTGYSVKVGYSSRELTNRERVSVKDLTKAISLGDVTKTGPFVFDVDYYVRLDITNPLSDGEKTYTKYVIVTKSGERLCTSSESFISSMEDIMAEFDDGEEYEMEAYRAPSKKRQGQEFLCCSLV